MDISAKLSKMPTRESLSTRESLLLKSFVNSLNYTQSYADLPLAYVNRGIAYINKGDYDKASADFETAIRLRPNLALAYYNRVLIRYLSGDSNRATVDFMKVLELGDDPAVQQQAKARLKELGVK